MHVFSFCCHAAQHRQRWRRFSLCGTVCPGRPLEGKAGKSTVSRLGDGAFAFFAHIFLRSLRAFYFFFAAAAVRRRFVAFERDGAALALKLAGAERVRPVEELRQILDRVTVEVVNGLLDAEFFDLV